MIRIKFGIDTYDTCGHRTGDFDILELLSGANQGAKK